MVEGRATSQAMGLYNWHVDDLLLFCALVDAGGFSAASRLTSIPKARLSRRIAALETGLGVRLIERTTRSFRITDVGERLLEHIHELRRAADNISAVASAYNASPVGALRVACPVGLADVFVGEVATAFMTAYPQVCLTFDVIDATVQPTFDRYDIIIMPSRNSFADSTSIAKRMLLTPYHLVASPALIARTGKLRTPEELSAVAFLGWGDTLKRETLVLECAGETIEVPVATTLRTNNLLVVKQAAAAGAGFASLPAMMCQRELHEGTLVQILEGYNPQPMHIHACFPTRRSLTAAGRTFLTMLESKIDHLLTD